MKDNIFIWIVIGIMIAGIFHAIKDSKYRWVGVVIGNDDIVVTGNHCQLVDDEEDDAIHIYCKNY